MTVAHTSPSWVVLYTTVVLVTLCNNIGSATEARHAVVPTTERQHTIHVSRLHPGEDHDHTPVLISVSESSTMRVPKQHKNNNTYFSFDENFDPIWYYTLQRRGFDAVEWSGCGGKWRPEWSALLTNHDDEDDGIVEEDLSFAPLRHALAHHVVCTSSSVSFCAAAADRQPQQQHAAMAEEPETETTRHQAAQFQWAAQFVSMLTSSPLSWTRETPRHIRPTGVVQPRSNSNNNSNTTPNGWCSYHVVNHDTLCTQHVSPLLNGGRSDSSMQEGLPDGIFKATVTSFYDLFSTPFTQFHVRATRQPRAAAADGGGEVEEYRLDTRISFVVWDAAEIKALAALWRKELPQRVSSGDKLRIHVGRGGIPKQLEEALPNFPPKQMGDSQDSRGAIHSRDTKQTKMMADTSLKVPELSYNVHSIGKDHGYLSVYLQPSMALMGAAAEAAAMPSSPVEEPRLKVGDVVHTLLLFPLHLVRPQLYNVESLLGSSSVHRVRLDADANTLLVELRTVMAEAHVRVYERSCQQLRRTRGGDDDDDGGESGAEAGILLARLQFRHGWAALWDMPRDANSYRLVPQPIALYERRVSASASTCDDQCRLQEGEWLSGIAPDHSYALRWMFSNSKNNNNSSNMHSDDCVCSYMVRSTYSAGALIPAPDAAMIFNVLALGLVFSAIAVGWFLRVSRKLMCREEGQADGTHTPATEKT